MSNKRYLEFDSTYRNRNCYPCPAEFTTRVSCVKESDTGLTANDYVANEYPTNSWYQVPYAGADATDMLNTDYVLSGALSGLDIQQNIPMVINGKSYSSLYPVDWMNGGSTAYFAPLAATTLAAGGGPISIGSGIASKTSPIAQSNTGVTTMGTRFQGSFCSGAPGQKINTPNNNFASQRDQFWISTSIRNRNILAPEKFSGGTASAPQLGPKSLAQGKFKNYFAGALLFRFTKNPLLDTNVGVNGAVGVDDVNGFGNNATNGIPLLGSLGFPYFYQTLTFASPPPVSVVIGTQLNSTNSSGNPISGFVASIISQQEVVIRLGAAIPIGNNSTSQVTPSGGSYPTVAVGVPPRNLFPGVPPNLETIDLSDGASIKFVSSSLVTITEPPNAVPTGTVNWTNPSSVSDAYPAYFWNGFVESAVIQAYDETSGIVTLDHPFSNAGTNGFNTANDYYLMDFNTDPSGHWSSTVNPTNPLANINNGKARTFFPGGLDIPNYYSGRKITNISLEEVTTEKFGLQDSTVSGYDNNRRVLTLSNSIIPTRPSYRGAEICSQYTIVCLKQPITEELPAGSFIAWNGTGAGSGGGTIGINPAATITSGTSPIPNSFSSTPTTSYNTSNNDIPGVYYIAISAPKNSTYLVLQGSRNSFQSTTTLYRTSPLINMLGGVQPATTVIKTDQPSITVGSVQVPPYSDPSILAHWRESANWSELTPDPDFPLNIAGTHGAQSIMTRGKHSVQQDNNIVPYIPLSSLSLPGNCPVTLRNSGVLTLEIESGGLGYSINKSTMPLMALINIPYTTGGADPWDPSGGFPGMAPIPENFANGAGGVVYTFLNICFVNVKSVGMGGEILELEVNTPGSGYPNGTRVFIIDGSGADVSTYNAQAPDAAIWREGLGRGATARVTESVQFLGIAGGSKLDLSSIPQPGSLVDMLTYGSGQPSTERTLFNSAPDIGKFKINYSGASGSEYSVTIPQYPLEIQNCLGDETTYPETGTRVITQAFRSINNQVLIPPSTTRFGVGTTYQSFQYPAPGAYLGGHYGFTQTEHHLNNGGQNDVLWIALESNYDISKCVNEFAFSRDGYVSGKYSFGSTSGLYSDVGDVLTMPLIPPGVPDAATGLGQWTDQRTLPMGQSPVPTTGALYIQGGLQMPNSLTGNWIQILSFSRDNEKALNYTGSTTSQNQMVCYEIELISLILPNLPLDNTIGGLIAFYPYLYVELSNKTAPSGGTKGVLYSNNPHANRALFRVAIDDTPTPIISKFIKVDGDGAVQTVKFKPNDNLYIRVFLQNGQLFETKQRDTPPPMVPDPFVQISAEFSIKRLV